MSSSHEVAATSATETAMTTADVERLVRSVIVERGLGCTVLSVTGAPAGWNVMVRSGAGGLVRFGVSTQRSIAARATIVELLKEAL